MKAPSQKTMKKFERSQHLFLHDKEWSVEENEQKRKISSPSSKQVHHKEILGQENRNKELGLDVKDYKDSAARILNCNFVAYQL